MNEGIKNPPLGQEELPPIDMAAFRKEIDELKTKFKVGRYSKIDSGELMEEDASMWHRIKTSTNAHEISVKDMTDYIMYHSSDTKGEIPFSVQLFVAFVQYLFHRRWTVAGSIERNKTEMGGKVDLGYLERALAETGDEDPYLKKLIEETILKYKKDNK